MVNGMIETFTGKYSFLSNHFRCGVSFRDVRYESVQSAYNALRWQHEHDENWLSLRFGIMQQLIDDKFIIHQGLSVKLVRTAPHKLVYRNNDGNSFWGVTPSGGENRLGLCLMRIRARLIRIPGIRKMAERKALS